MFNAQTNVEYGLNKELTPGDVIKAWGVYKDDSTSKFRHVFSTDLTSIHEIFLSGHLGILDS